MIIEVGIPYFFTVNIRVSTAPCELASCLDYLNVLYWKVVAEQCDTSFWKINFETKMSMTEKFLNHSL